MRRRIEGHAEEAQRMLALREKGYAWSWIAHRFGMAERDARRICSAWLRAREEGRDGEPEQK